MLPLFCWFASVFVGGVVPEPVSVPVAGIVPVVSVPVVVVVSLVAGGMVDMSADVLVVSVAGIVPVVSVAGAAAGAVVSVVADWSAAC